MRNVVIPCVVVALCVGLTFAAPQYGNGGTLNQILGQEQQLAIDGQRVNLEQQTINVQEQQLASGNGNPALYNQIRAEQQQVNNEGNQINNLQRQIDAEGQIGGVYSPGYGR